MPRRRASLSILAVAIALFAACSHTSSVAGTYVTKAAGLDFTLTLKDDGTWTGQIGPGQGGGTYTVDGDAIVFRQPGTSVTQRGTIHGDRLVLRHGAVSLTFVKQSKAPSASSTTG